MVGLFKPWMRERGTVGAELLFEVFSQRYERGSILVTTNLLEDVGSGSLPGSWRSAGMRSGGCWRTELPRHRLAY